MDTVDVIKGCNVFSGLGDEELREVAATAQEREFSTAEAIVEEDREGGSFFLVVRGRVDVEVGAPHVGRSERITTLKPGDVFGELALVDGCLRSATVRAVEPVTALVFDGDELTALMERNHAIGYRVMRNIAKVLSSRIRGTNMRLRNTLADLLYY